MRCCQLTIVGGIECEHRTEIKFRDLDNRLSARTHTQLAQNLADVSLDGCLADIEYKGDLLVE